MDFKVCPTVAHNCRIGIERAKEYPLTGIIKSISYHAAMAVNYGLPATDKFIFEIDTEKRLDEFSPIPLTEEWLMKAGFVKLSKECYGHIVTVYELNGIRIGLSGDDFYLCTEILDRDDCLYWETLGIPIATVHQLQNLYFSLCGEELNIALPVNT